MKFDFFTLGGRFFWEDIYNYQNWIIQKHINKQQYRLLDPFYIRRDYGSFERCKETLVKYIEGCELDIPYDDTVLILHGFGRTRNSVSCFADALKDLPANIICVNYASFRAGLNFHAKMLERFIRNLDIKGRLFIINIGASCLLTRKLLSNSDDYRMYQIARILDINPLNSGSDLAELLGQNKIAQKILGPMLRDIETKKAVSLPKLPREIDHGLIFCQDVFRHRLKKMLSRLESIPFSTPPSEQSYAEKRKIMQDAVFFPLRSRELIENCRKFLAEGEFLPDDD